MTYRRLHFMKPTHIKKKNGGELITLPPEGTLSPRKASRPMEEY